MAEDAVQLARERYHEAEGGYLGAIPTGDQVLMIRCAKTAREAAESWRSAVARAIDALRNERREDDPELVRADGSHDLAAQLRELMGRDLARSWGCVDIADRR